MKSITTGLGDGGETGLLSGERIAKNHPRIEAIGDLDELASVLGDAKCAAGKARTRETIEWIQEKLQGFMGGLSLSPEAARSRNFGHDALPAEKQLAAWTAEFEAARPMTGFVLPGKTPAGAKIDIARTVCRRAERRVVALHAVEPLEPVMLAFINRLSDLLYALARFEED